MTECAEDEVLTSVDFQYIEKEFGYPFYVSFLLLNSKACF